MTIDLDKGYIVRVNKRDCFKVNCPRELYLPHHLVFYPRKPGKVRIVFNGAAKFQGSLLNNALLTGPDLLQNIIHVLICFRQYQDTASANIESIFWKLAVFHKTNRHFVFVAGGPSWRNSCVPRRASLFWNQRFANMHQLCAQTDRN